MPTPWHQDRVLTGSEAFPEKCSLSWCPYLGVCVCEGSPLPERVGSPTPNPKTQKRSPV